MRAKSGFRGYKPVGLVGLFIGKEIVHLVHEVLAVIRVDHAQAFLVDKAHLASLPFFPGLF